MKQISGLQRTSFTTGRLINQMLKIFKGEPCLKPLAHRNIIEKENISIIRLSLHRIIR